MSSDKPHKANCLLVLRAADPAGGKSDRLPSQSFISTLN